MFRLDLEKETDSIHLELTSFDERLTLNMVARKGEFMHLPTRAAAISATQILVNKAALALDVSPDEFEALEPRLRSGSPMLQIADALIMGLAFAVGWGTGCRFAHTSYRRLAA